jgi:NitT/TauT family transport system ATP-binding protein
MDIVASNLYKSFGDKLVLQDFSTVFPAGTLTCLMGPSGCGKTTLLRILMGLEKADAGSVTGLPRRLSAVFQEDRLCEGFSAVSNIRLVTGRSIPAALIESHLLALGLGGSPSLPVREFSGGMKRRVALVRAVLARWELLLLDEPFKGLDEDTRRTAAAYLREHTAGRTVIMVTHDPAEVELTGGRLLRMLPAEG